MLAIVVTLQAASPRVHIYICIRKYIYIYRYFCVYTAITNIPHLTKCTRVLCVDSIHVSRSVSTRNTSAAYRLEKNTWDPVPRLSLNFTNSVWKFLPTLRTKDHPNLPVPLSEHVNGNQTNDPHTLKRLEILEDLKK